ncbi:MAG: tyrosine-protein phosphatase [Clostridia bacterium]|nr:tyrosine-protein phosphatase [Clostridia bacterium]
MIPNFRDLGGLAAADGKTIRPGLLFRSADLSSAESADLSGISAVVDLRTPAECAERPDRCFSAVRIAAPFFVDAIPGLSHEEENELSGVPDLTRLYAILIRSCCDAIREALLTVLRHDFTAGGILWHCTEGKDRSGILTALVLGALGVKREEILRDYLLTNRVSMPKAEQYREQLADRYGPEPAERIYHAMIAEERYLEAAWAEMGPDYLTARLGVDEPTLARFRASVLTDHSSASDRR